MYKPLALFMGLRYTQSRKKNHFVSFISLSSMLGIGLGVMVLITVLSVMNGFDEQIHNRFFGMAPEITVVGPNEKLANWPEVEKKVQNIAQIKAISPYISGQGLLTHEGQVMPLLLTGILPNKVEQVNHLQDKLLAGSMAGLNHFGILLGKVMADNLGLMIGDKVSIMIPQATVTPAGMIPRFKRFTLVGIFSAGSGFNFDSKLGFIHLEDAQKLLQMGQFVTGLQMKIANVYQAPELSYKISEIFGG